MSEELRAIDVLRELPARRVVGHRLVRSVGARAWERPSFARFTRFFERCGLPSPWDPDARAVEIGLGEVGIASRKTVAPHAAPPRSASSSGPKVTKAPNIPAAPRAAEAEPKAPPPGSRPAPRIGEMRRDDTETLKKKLAESERLKANPARANTYKVQQPLAKLPVRPELGAGEPGGTEPVPALSTSGARGSPSADPRTMPRPAPRPAPRPGPGGAARPSRMPVEASRRPQVPDGPEEIEEQPPAPPAQRPGASDAWRGFGMDAGWDDDDAPRGAPSPSPSPAPPAAAAPTATSSPAQPAAAAPTATPAPAQPAAAAPTATRASPDTPRPSVPAPSAPRAPAPAAPPRPARPGGGGMDDLFGMGASGENTRVRMPKRDDTDAARSRRPLVTSEADLAKGGIDRRPPPPKAPPVATPASGRVVGAGAEPEGDGGE